MQPWRYSTGERCRVYLRREKKEGEMSVAQGEKRSRDERCIGMCIEVHVPNSRRCRCKVHAYSHNKNVQGESWLVVLVKAGFRHSAVDTQCTHTECTYKKCTRTRQPPPTTLPSALLHHPPSTLHTHNTTKHTHTTMYQCTQPPPTIPNTPQFTVV